MITLISIIESSPDANFTLIVTAMGSAIAALSTYIVYLQKTLNGSQESRIKFMLDQIAVVKALYEEIEKQESKEKPKGSHPHA